MSIRDGHNLHESFVAQVGGFVYIAGPMRRTVGHDNRAAFRQAQERLESRQIKAFNPADYPNPDDYGGVCFGVQIVARIDCKGVALIDGWEESAGARAEASTAVQLGKPARLLEDWANDE